jgi:hypothetical protein
MIQNRINIAEFWKNLSSDLRIKSLGLTGYDLGPDKNVTWRWLEPTQPRFGCNADFKCPTIPLDVLSAQIYPNIVLFLDLWPQRGGKKPDFLRRDLTWDSDDKLRQGASFIGAKFISVLQY